MNEALKQAVDTVLKELIRAQDIFEAAAQPFNKEWPYKLSDDNDAYNLLERSHSTLHNQFYTTEGEWKGG